MSIERVNGQVGRMVTEKGLQSKIHFLDSQYIVKIRILNCYSVITEQTNDSFQWCHPKWKVSK